MRVDSMTSRVTVHGAGKNAPAPNAMGIQVVFQVYVFIGTGLESR